MENGKQDPGYIKKVFRKLQEIRKKQKEIKKLDLKRMTVGFIGAIKWLSFPTWGRLKET